MPSEGARQETKYAPLQSRSYDWLVRAECRGTPMIDGVSVFFPNIVKSSGRPTKGHHEAPLTEFYEEAIAICARCPVIDECFTEYSRDPIPKHGMYFGKTPSQRARIKTGMHEAMLAKIRELVPFKVDIEDCATEDAQRINAIHVVLYGVVIPGYAEGFWGE